jgi:hypothetical protein
VVLQGQVPTNCLLLGGTEGLVSTPRILAQTLPASVQPRSCRSCLLFDTQTLELGKLRPREAEG